jgi:20S proteasome alpha/beta subunit
MKHEPRCSKPSPADWRAAKVTVCIAALAEGGKKIVMASDSKAAFGDFSADRGVIKNIPIGHYYAILIAGNDVGYAMPTIQRIKKVMPKDITDPDSIAMLVHEQLVITRKHKIEARLLSKLGFTVDSFMKTGKDLLTESVYYDLISEIRREELSLTFLLAGFDSAKRGHLRIVTSDDSPQDFDMLNFAAIGSGAQTALASLSFAKDHCGLYHISDMAHVTYHVLAAKFMAESATDVGRQTFFVCTGPDGECHFLNPFAGGVEPIRRIWEESGAPKPAQQAIEAARDLMHEGDEDPESAECLTRAMKYASPAKKSLIELKLKQLTSGTSMGQQ